MTRFITLFTAFFSFLIPAFSQDGPCLHVLQNGTEAALSANTCPTGGKHSDAGSNQLKVEFRHPDKTASVDDSNGWLKAFWIFGDGNFAAFPDSDKATEERTLDLDYTFQSAGDYTVIPLIVEKKTNRLPPGNDYRKIRVSDTKSPADGVKGSGATAAAKSTPTPFRQQIQGNETADILPSAQVRLGGYETALAVSSKMPSSTVQAVALVYFNSVKTKDGGAYRSGEIFKAGAIRNAEVNYSPNAAYIIPTGSLPGFLDGEATSGVYSQVMAKRMDVNYQVLPASFNEFRLFPMFTTPVASDSSFNTGIPGIDTTGMGFTQFTTLILHNSTVSQDGSQFFFGSGQGAADPISNAERDTILARINRYLPWLNGRFDPNTLQMSNGSVIRGVDHYESEIVSVIDPTELRVNRICPDADAPDKYKAELTMTVCNEGNMTEDRVVVQIVKTPGVVITDLVFDSTEISHSLASNSGNIVWEFDYSKNGGLKGAYEDGSYHSSCFDVHFSVKTDWDGVLALQKGEALTAKVHFTSAIVNAIQEFPNLPFEEAKVTPKTGYNCGGDDTAGSCMWLWVVLFALGLVAWWYWKNNQEE